MKDRARGRHIKIEAASAGTGGWHRGNSADARMTKAAARRGYDLSAHKASQTDMGDFYVHDFIFAMDESNFTDLKELQPADGTARLEMFLARTGGGDVPDPYYGGEDGFDHVIDLVERAVDAIIDEMEARYKDG